ncbi:MULTISPECIES: phage tail tip lysozyme [unclassified Aureimonas]|uniref:phage tail tip lysozyme n=1 Tax=unclassified Aureimonas TaxID=2615206 RepID=UPI0006F2EFCD|nr:MULTISPECIES: phage tail tip lysozyme [unclassified Aureimonas]KQT60363.1 hypothetical protein ASG62_06815 [Aureimonas sp. Leaf427]KQT79241.1 hypothetical protein ASG54_09415 [Aureimonas sp. Leaf460]
MTQYASLGFEINSKPALDAAAQLDKLTAAAGKTEAAAAGLNNASKKAFDGLSATAAAAKKAQAENDNLARSVASLRAEFNPLLAVTQRYQASLDAITKAEAAGGLSAREAASYRAQATQAAERQSAALVVVGDKAKLTSNQLLNLSRQGNDVATMWALGAPPMQIFASQIGQVVDALQSGPGGLAGSLKAVGEGIASLITPGRLAVVGLTAIAGAAIYYGVQGMRSIKPLSEAMEDHKKIIGEIGKSYGLAIDAQSAYASGATRTFQLRRSAEELQLSSRTSLLDSGFAGGGDMTRARSTESGGRTYEARRGFEAFEGPLVKLAEGLKAGTEDARAFVDEVAKIANLDPTNETLRDTANKLIELAKEAAAAKQQLDAFASARSRLAGTQFKEAMGDLRGFVPDNRTDRSRLDQSLQVALGKARTEADERSARATHLAGLQEIERREGVIRAGRDLDIRSINARTTAERAGIAAEQERLALSGQVMEASEREARISHASAMVYEADARQQADDLRDRARARGDMIRSLQDEAATLDMTRGAAEAYRQQQTMILQLYREAEDAGRVVDPSEVQAIRDTTAAAGALTDQLDRLRMVRSQMEDLRGLDMQASTIGQSEDFARQAGVVYDMQRKLREQGIDLNSEFARGQIANTRALSDYGDAIRRQADAWGELKGAGDDAIDTLVDGLASGTADVKDLLKGVAKDTTSTFLQLAVSNPLKNMLLGTSLGTLGDLMGGTKSPSLSSAGAGASALGTVTMTAAVVNLNGAGGIAPLLGGGEKGGAANALDKLLNPANGNSAGAKMAGGSVEAQIANYFTAKGLAPHQVAGILGNVSAESAFNPTAVGDAGQAFGLFQHNDRKNNLFASIGGKQNLGNVQSQLDFAWKELQTTENPAFRRLLASKDVRGATAAFAGFERPQGFSLANPEGAHNFGGRLSAAEKSFERINASAEKMASSTDSTVSAFASNARSLTDGLAGTFSGLDQEMLKIANDFTPRMSGVLQSVLDAFASGLGNKGGFSGSWISALAGNITGGMTGAPGGGDAWAGLRLAGGGGVYGPGTGTSDSIHAMLSNGEFVVNAASTAKHRGVLEAINGGGVKTLAHGGFASMADAIGAGTGEDGEELILERPKAA